MKTLNLIVLLLLISGTAFADCEYFAVENPDGSIKSVCYVSGSSDSLGDVLASIGVTNEKVEKVHPADLHLLSENVKNLKFQGKRIVVDQEKKNQEEIEKQDREAEREAVLAKLRITKEEFEKLK